MNMQEIGAASASDSRSRRRGAVEGFAAMKAGSEVVVAGAPALLCGGFAGRVGKFMRGFSYIPSYRGLLRWEWLREWGYTHSPFRIRGSAVPSAATPSTSISPEPIIQSTWIRLAFAPSLASASVSIFSPPMRQVE
jgi:hypothetical protein